MVWLNFWILAVAAVPNVPPEDLDRADAQAGLYPTRAWACVGGFIAFVSLCHFVSLFSLLWRPVTPHSSAPRNRNVIHIQRLPVALMHTFRVIAFRWTISLGDSYTLNLAEVFMTAGYIAILFAWTFVNCTLHPVLMIWRTYSRFSIATSSLGSKVNPHIYANTAGHIVATQISLTAALGMKNNIISCRVELAYVFSPIH